MSERRYELNEDLLRNLNKFNIKNKTLAEHLGISESAVSQRFSDRNFSMAFIDTIAELGRLPLGCFQKVRGGQAVEPVPVGERRPPVYRLYMLVQVLLGIYGTMDMVHEVTSVPKERLKKMKRKVQDEHHGLVTPSEALKEIHFADYLTLLNHVPNPYQWQYIEDPNGLFPIPGDSGDTMVPVAAFNNFRSEMDARLRESSQQVSQAQALYEAEKMRLEQLTAENASLREKCDGLQTQLKRVGDMLSTRNSDVKYIKNVLYREQEKIMEQFKLIMSGTNPDTAMEKIREIFEHDRKDIDGKYGDRVGRE